MENKNKETYLIKARPGTFFMEISRIKIENNLFLKDIIQKYFTRDEMEKGPETVCFFVIEKKFGNRKIAKKYHIGEIYSLERIEEEFGKNCSLYRNIKNNKFQSAIKYIPGNFGGVDKKDVCFTQKEILDMLQESVDELVK